MKWKQTKLIPPPSPSPIKRTIRTAFLRRMPVSIRMVVPNLTGRLEILRKMLLSEKIDEDVVLGKIYRGDISTSHYFLPLPRTTFYLYLALLSISASHYFVSLTIPEFFFLKCLFYCFLCPINLRLLVNISLVVSLLCLITLIFSLSFSLCNRHVLQSFNSFCNDIQTASYLIFEYTVSCVWCINCKGLYSC